ncbi:MAG: ADP-ribosylglycohydrolase family protein, partial [Anaerolineae bacterium]|nr:ADP-ribosylglycohydrolase family protein [Anaerolineae bacterium]
MTAPQDYAERVYAGMLGKAIGVYLGHPFETWGFDRIIRDLGEVNYYVNERMRTPIVTTDDDLSGMLTFLRAVPDYGFSKDVTPEQVGKTWLNYLIKDVMVLWWGGRGISTEHTAWLNLKRGISAPASGSIETNGQLVAEQIGAQIFIDSWAMLAPGDPEYAADLARRASSVSHDGEAIYGAQIIAAMEALAFIEPDLNKCIDGALRTIPADSVIAAVIHDLREWHAKEPDWYRCREWLDAKYGYDAYRGTCHMVPNHAAILLSLLYGDDSFQKSLMISVTSGWDTDCNGGNVGCFLGIKNGLAGMDREADWRTPWSDRIYMQGADPGRVITDAVIESYHIVNMYRRMNGLEPVVPKNGVCFHFEFPGALQGFRVEGTDAALTLENVAGHSRLGNRALALRYGGVRPGKPARAATPTFIPHEYLTPSQQTSHDLSASPTLYSGQTVRVWVSADAHNPASVTARLDVRIYGADDRLTVIPGTEAELAPGANAELVWLVPDTQGHPIAEVGLEVDSHNTTSGVVYLDALTWDGEPDVTFTDPRDGCTMWRRGWVKATDKFMPVQRNDPVLGNRGYYVSQDDGIGLLMQGAREWRNYRASSKMAV